MLRTNARANVLGGEVRVVREVIESSLLVPWIGVPAWLPPTGWGPTLSCCLTRVYGVPPTTAREKYNRERRPEAPKTLSIIPFNRT